MSGVEDEPEQSGEICVAEIFGDAVRDGAAAVGIGIKPYADPALRDAFATERVELDVAAFHTYRVDWRPGSLEFAIDGERVRSLDQAPDYPLQLFIGIFELAGRPAGAADPPVPEVVVSHVRGGPIS
jgi:beta-glucanase (GH16 family)